MFFLNRNSQWPHLLPVTLMLLVAVSFASEADDGLGKADAPPNRITGQVVLADGQPASHATIR
ncbi:MAG: hypothetical protein ABI557_05590 [Aureliella sp.]